MEKYPYAAARGSEDEYNRDCREGETRLFRIIHKKVTAMIGVRWIFESRFIPTFHYPEAEAGRAAAGSVPCWQWESFTPAIYPL
jgi:hypothetical protein